MRPVLIEGMHADLMVDPVGIGTTCVCMHASQKTVYSTCAGQSNMSKTKSKGGKETARKKKEKDRIPPLLLNHHKDCNILLSVIVNSYTKIKKQMLPFCEGR